MDGSRLCGSPNPVGKYLAGRKRRRTRAAKRVRRGMALLLLPVGSRVYLSSAIHSQRTVDCRNVSVGEHVGLACREDYMYVFDSVT
jgi:hypothetical protein